jgi:hypothetical protein
MSRPRRQGTAISYSEKDLSTAAWGQADEDDEEEFPHPAPKPAPKRKAAHSSSVKPVREDEDDGQGSGADSADEDEGFTRSRPKKGVPVRKPAAKNAAANTKAPATLSAAGGSNLGAAGSGSTHGERLSVGADPNAFCSNLRAAGDRSESTAGFLVYTTFGSSQQRLCDEPIAENTRWLTLACAGCAEAFLNGSISAEDLADHFLKKISVS